MKLEITLSCNVQTDGSIDAVTVTAHGLSEQVIIDVEEGQTLNDVNLELTLLSLGLRALNATKVEL